VASVQSSRRQARFLRPPSSAPAITTYTAIGALVPPRPPWESIVAGDVCISNSTVATEHLRARLVETARVLAATQVQGSRDYVGFNPQDMEFGRRLANIVDVAGAEHPAAVELLARLLTRRYVRQTETLLSPEEFRDAVALSKPTDITMEDRALTRKTVTVTEVSDGFALGWQENNELLAEVLAFGARERVTASGVMYVVHAGALQPIVLRLRARGFEIALDEKIAGAIDRRTERRVAALAPSPNAIPVWLQDGRLIIKLPPVAEYVAIVRDIPDRRYDGKAKTWSVPEEQGLRLRDLLADKGADVTGFDALPLTDGDMVLQRLGVSLRGSRYVLLLPFDAELISRVRSIPDARYDPEAKAWTIPANELRTFEKRLSEHKIPYDRRQLDAAIATLPPPPKEYIAPIPDVVFAHDPPLLPYQREAIEFLSQPLTPLREKLGAGLRGLVNGDPRGTGKTTEVAIAAHCVTPPDEQIVVLCRAAGKLSWRDEIRSWLGEDQTVGFPSLSEPVPNTRWLIVTYGMLETVYEPLKKRGIGTLVIDEGHRIARLGTQRSKLVLGYQPREGEAVDGLCSFVRSGRVFDTTGSLIRNRIRDTFAAWKAVGHPLGNSFYRFANRYCGPRKVLVGEEERTTYDGASHLEELRELVSPILLERPIEQLLPQLPEKVRRIRLVDIDLKKYNAEMAQFEDFLASGVAGDRARMLRYLNEERALTALALVDATIDFVDELVNDGVKVVVWSSYREVLRKVAGHFGKAAVEYHGSLTDRQRERVTKAFNTDDKVRVFAGQVDAAGESLSLTPAGQVIVVMNDLLWVPEDLKQVEDRAYGLRLKGSSLEINWMAAAGTIIEHMVPILDRKVQDVTAFQAGTGITETAVLGELIAELRGTIGQQRRAVNVKAKADAPARAPVARPKGARTKPASPKGRKKS